MLCYVQGVKWKLYSDTYEDKRCDLEIPRVQGQRSITVTHWGDAMLCRICVSTRDLIRTLERRRYRNFSCQEQRSLRRRHMWGDINDVLRPGHEWEPYLDKIWLEAGEVPETPLCSGRKTPCIGFSQVAILKKIEVGSKVTSYVATIVAS